MLVIAAIDLIEGDCVRLLRGDYARRTAYGIDPVKQAVHFQECGFDRIHMVDLDGARAGSLQQAGIIRRVAAAVQSPVQVGGGLRNSPDVRRLAGLKNCFLILGSSVLLEPLMVEAWMKAWGTDRFIVSLDVEEGVLRTHGWQRSAPVALTEAVDLISGWGIRQVICTDVTRDGTLTGPNFRLLERLVGGLPPQTTVLAAGGISTPDQVGRLAECGVGGAIIGRALYEGNTSEKEFSDAG